MLLLLLLLLLLTTITPDALDGASAVVSAVVSDVTGGFFLHATR